MYNSSRYDALRFNTPFTANKVIPVKTPHGVITRNGPSTLNSMVTPQRINATIESASQPQTITSTIAGF